MMENYTTMEATRNEVESGKVDSASSSHFEPPKLVLGCDVERNKIDVPYKDILDYNYDSPLDLSTRGCSSTQNFQPEDFAGGSETPQEHLHSSKQQKREKALENSCSVLRKDASASKSKAKWKCGTCPRWFRSEAALNVHLLSDCDYPNPYKCDKCPKEFDREALLARHKIIHTGEKPFKCDHCGHTYTRKSDLKVHTEKIHKK